MCTCGYGPGGSQLSSSPSKVISSFLMSIDHVENTRWWRHGERNNSKDGGEGHAGPTDGLIQRRCSFGKPGSSGHMSAMAVIRLFTGTH